MSTQAWSFVLQWSRVGINAALFLIATRFLSLAEIGLFATAFAPVRMSQGLHRAGIAESVIILGKRQDRLDALFILSASSGLSLSILFGFVGYLATIPALIVLSIIPMLNGLSAVSEGLLRRSLRLRALALRTVVIQSIAAGFALWLLVHGWGIWSLVSFAVVNAIGNCTLTCLLARWTPKRLSLFRNATLLLPKVTQIAARDMVGAAQIPLALLAIGLTLGLSAAGAFQIATRIYNLIDALTLSPLRFIALPQLAQDVKGLRNHFAKHLSQAAWLSSWIWAGVLLFTPQLMRLILTPDHTAAAAPILQALAGLGLCSALTMPLNQALTVRMHTGLVLRRAIAMLCLGTLLLLPALLFSPVLCGLALSLAALCISLWYAQKALPHLFLTHTDLAPCLPPLFSAGLVCLAVLLTPNLPMIAQMLCGSLLYFGIAALLQNPRMEHA